VHNGDDITVLVENHVGGSYATQQVVDLVVDMNGIANRNVIHATSSTGFPLLAAAVLADRPTAESAAGSSRYRAASRAWCTGQLVPIVMPLLFRLGLAAGARR
jgi:hypothetical protein